MTHAVPLLSALSALTELFVTAAVFYVLYVALTRNELKVPLLAAALGYEVLFNISYMSWRLFTHPEPSHHPSWMVALVAGHGTLSLAMFVALVAVSVVATRAHRAGRNVFRERQALTYLFAGLWVVSLASGYAIFGLEYLGHY
jgi:putative flippase GtrA